MISKKNIFKNLKKIPNDKFFEKILFDKKKGYYSTKVPFGKSGDYLTSPNISNLFSEMLGIWIVSIWSAMGKPKNFNLVELGPGKGNLMKVLIKTFKSFPDFNKSINIFLYEKSKLLRNIQNKILDNSKVRWINKFDKIKDGPVLFFGNEFFDSIPIKQFSLNKKILFEKYYLLNKKNKINEFYKKASRKDLAKIKEFKVFKKAKFIEYPKMGINELDKMIKIISKLKGGVLLIDYGYLKQKNKNTIQSVFKHRRNDLLENLGEADITYLVNFKFLREYFIKNKLKVKKVVSQRFFLQKMGIVERANILSKKMNFNEQANLYLRLKRLLDKKFMGDLFKVIFAYKFNRNDFPGFN